jgi:hypothetical protein
LQDIFSEQQAGIVPGFTPFFLPSFKYHYPALPATQNLKATVLYIFPIPKWFQVFVIPFLMEAKIQN